MRPLPPLFEEGSAAFGTITGSTTTFSFDIVYLSSHNLYPATIGQHPSLNRIGTDIGRTASICLPQRMQDLMDCLDTRRVCAVSAVERSFHNRLIG
jgi:hypothetical protein